MRVMRVEEKGKENLEVLRDSLTCLSGKSRRKRERGGVNGTGRDGTDGGVDRGA
jgi:hypothetical protein